MTTAEPGGTPTEDQNEAPGILRHLINKLWNGTEPGSWTPVWQSIAMIITVVGMLCFLIEVIQDDSLMAAELWSPIGLGTSACALGFMLMRHLEHRRSRRELRKRSREAAHRAARRRSAPTEPVGALTSDPTEKSDNNDRQDQP